MYGRRIWKQCFLSRSRGQVSFSRRNLKTLHSCSTVLGKCRVLVDTPWTAQLLCRRREYVQIFLVSFADDALLSCLNPSLPGYRPPGSALYTDFKRVLATHQRDSATEWTADALACRLVEAVTTFPKGAPPAKAKIVDLIMHSFRAAFDRIREMLREQRGRRSRGGGDLRVRYVLSVPAGWDDVAMKVMLQAAERAGGLLSRKCSGMTCSCCDRDCCHTFRHSHHAHDHRSGARVCRSRDHLVSFTLASSTCWVVFRDSQLWRWNNWHFYWHPNGRRDFNRGTQHRRVVPDLSPRIR